MFFKPKRLFFRSPTPRRRLESSRTEGNSTPVLGSTNEPSGELVRVREAHKGEDSDFPKTVNMPWLEELVVKVNPTATPIPNEAATAEPI